MNIPSLSIEGRIALVTGSRRGIGKAIALRFAEAGADVAVCDYVAGAELDSVAEEIRKIGCHSLATQVDIRNKTSVNNLVQKIENNLGDIDILANVAGVFRPCPLVDLPEEDWDRTLDTNLKGYYLCSQAVLRGMIKRKRGNIINIASTDGFNPIASQVAYNCSKAGVHMLTNVLAFEVGRYGIRVNAIAPGYTRTAMQDFLKSNPTAAKDATDQIALGRMAEPIEIANIALVLASDLASFVTGATWRVDGGTNSPSLQAGLSMKPETF